jgi:hypothetical protein
MITYVTQPADDTGIVDTYIRSASGQDANYSTNPYNMIGRYVPGGVANVNRILTKFDLSYGTNPPLGKAKIMSGYLQINVGESYQTMNLDLYQILHGWYYDSATWNIAGAGGDVMLPWYTVGCGGSGFDYNPTTCGTTLVTDSVPGYYTFTLTEEGIAVVQSWVDGTVTNNGFLMKSDKESTSGMLQVHSSNSVTAAKRPLLSLTYLIHGYPRIAII